MSQEEEEDEPILDPKAPALVPWTQAEKLAFEEWKRNHTFRTREETLARYKQKQEQKHKESK